MKEKKVLREIVTFLLLIWIFLGTIFYNTNVFFSYSDEVIGVIGFIYFAIGLIKRQFNRLDRQLGICGIILILIGTISNFFSRLILLPYPILVDALSIIKFIYIFIFIINFSGRQKDTIINRLSLVFSFFIVITFFAAVINIFADVGWSDGIRYGIKNFKFFFYTPGGCGITIFSCLAFCLHSNIKKITKNMLIVMSIFVGICTTKGLVISIIVIFIGYAYFIEENKKMSIKSLSIIAIVITLLSSYQIKEYLMDNSSLRSILIRNGFITANKYFPLGAGFATYGSEMSRQFYSPLYYEYGFDKQWGLSFEYPMFLLDNCLGMIVGQFGYIGLFVWGIILKLLYSRIRVIKSNRNVKAIVYALFLCMLISTIATANIKSNTGSFVFASIAILISQNRKKTMMGMKDNSLKVNYKNRR